MAVALPGSITGSGFGSAQRLPSDGSAGQRPAATRETARDNLPLSTQGRSRVASLNEGRYTLGRPTLPEPGRTMACRRRRTASAPASLRLPAAPDARRYAYETQ